jgi:putative endonuclease
MRDYYIYIVRCTDDSLYIGLTNNYLRRLAQHNDENCSRHFTSKRRPVVLVHLEIFHDVFLAINREKQLKRWSRKKKEALIVGDEVFLRTSAECQNETHFKNKDHTVSPRAEPRGDTIA